MPPLPEGATVVGQGLWNPGDITLGEDGTIYIAESGVAGGDPSAPPPAATPGAEPATGPEPLVPPQVTAIAPDGTQLVLTTAAGGIGIDYFDQEVYVSTGGSSVAAGGGAA